MEDAKVFIEHIQREQLHHKECRHKFVAQKLLFITGLLGLGSVDILKGGQGGSFKFGFLLYFVPFIAIAYDLYIFAENFKVKRIGAFLKERCSGMREAWEKWVADHRETLAFYWGSFGLTMFSLLTSVGLVTYSYEKALHVNTIAGIVTYIWFGTAFIIMIIIFLHAKHIENELDRGQTSLRLWICKVVRRLTG